MSETKTDKDPYGVWICGAADCQAVVAGQNAERAIHARTAHPDHFGVLWVEGDKNSFGQVTEL